MNKLTPSVCLLWLTLSLSQPTHGDWSAPGTIGSRGSGPDAAALVEDLEAALADPAAWMERGRHPELAEKIRRVDGTVSLSPGSDSLQALLDAAKSSGVAHLRYLYGLSLFAVLRAHDTTGACAALCEAGSAAFPDLDHPALARIIYGMLPHSRCPQAAAALDGINHYLEHDRALDRLLRRSWHAIPQEQRRAHAAAIVTALQASPKTSLTVKAWLTLGDIHFGRGDHTNTIRWYGRAVAADSTLFSTTTAGYRIEESIRLRTIARIIIACYAVYGAALILLLVTAILSRGRVNTHFCIRAGIFFCASALILGAILLVDGWISRGAMVGLAQNEATKKYVTTPIVPLSALDSPSLLIVLMGAALIPVVFSLLCLSFRATLPRWAVVAAACVLAAAAWTHVITDSQTTRRLAPWELITRGHIFFTGEPETVFLDNPDKVLRAAPDILTSDNIDLRDFLREHYPDGNFSRKKRSSP